MKRYMLFGFDTYYPAGGMNDFLYDFDTIEEFKKYFITGRCDSYNVFDTVDRETHGYAMKTEKLKLWVMENVE